MVGVARPVYELALTFLLKVFVVNMNTFARFDEIPAMTLQDIKETNRYGQTDRRMNARTENVKTVYPNTVCVGYSNKWTCVPNAISTVRSNLTIRFCCNK